jgi:hypothetical protein
MKVTYVATDKVTAEGATIYVKRIAKQRGRPAFYVKKGDRYVKYTTPKATKAAVVA